MEASDSRSQSPAPAVRSLVCAAHGPYTAQRIALPAMVQARLGWAESEPRYTRCPRCSSPAGPASVGDSVLVRQQLARWREALEGLGTVPDRYAGVTFEQWQPTTPESARALDTARQFAAAAGRLERFGRFLILTGTLGTGKTMLACAIARSVLAAGRSALILKAMDVTRLVLGAMRSKRGHADTDVLRILTDVDLLVLDEIGVMYGSPNEQANLFTVIDNRYNAGRPLVLVTNNPLRNPENAPIGAPPDLFTLLGERTYDRLREVGKAVPMRWPSWRSNPTE